MNTRSKSNLQVDKLKKNKSTHGKKNWRKNIDISELEKKNVKLNREEMRNKEVEKMKDSDLFQMDVLPDNKNIPMLKKKIKRTDDKKKKNSIVEEKLLKRYKSTFEAKKECKDKDQEKVYDLWGSNNQDLKVIKSPCSRKYPKIPLPHPGQSYNPSKDDLTQLISKVVETHKPKLIEKEQEEIEERRFESSEEESEGEIDETHLVSNNPPVDDFSQRKTKAEKKKIRMKKLHKFKEHENKKRKENKIKLANEKSLKRIESERQVALNQKQAEEKQKKREEKVKEILIKQGVVDE